MELVAKSAIDKKAIESKVRICKNIEIQLFEEFNDLNQDVDELVNIITSVKDINLIAIHAPLSQKIGDFAIEFIQNDYYNKIFFKTCELANKLGEFYNKTIKIVIHTTFDYKEYEIFYSILNDITKNIEIALKKYDKIIFCIENVTPFFRRKNSFAFKNGVLDDNINLVKYLRETLKTDRIYTVLDTCHAWTTEEMVNRLLKDNYPEVSNLYNFERYFQINKDVIGLIHLADVIDIGFSEEKHGIKFSKDRYKRLHDVLYFYQKYQYNCPITIEIKEENYYINNNFKEMYDYLMPIIKNY